MGRKIILYIFINRCDREEMFMSPTRLRQLRKKKNLNIIYTIGRYIHTIVYTYTVSVYIGINMVGSI